MKWVGEDEVFEEPPVERDFGPVNHIDEFDVFCMRQLGRIGGYLRSVERRVKLGPEIDGTELQSGRLVLERRR